jgi:hypothetical protein
VLCDTHRNKAYSEKNKARLYGICDGCHEEYDAHKITYLHNRRNSKPCYCKICAETRRKSGVRAANLIRFAQARRAKTEAELAKNRFAAPCGRTIEATTEKENKRYQECHQCNWSGMEEYYVCRDEAIKRDWAGWRVV